ncbi:MAG: leucine-rich repeat protein [Paludibacteraceae bacterium]|nr:leucine-rich repeat protein [Paludibacteraceae bacterium]
MKQKLLTLVVCSLLAIGSMNAAPITGTFKNGGTWTILNHVLYVEAEVIPDYPGGYTGCAPWCSYRTVKSVELKGVKKIGKYAFWHMESITNVYFSDKTQADVEIGYGAFTGCYSLRGFDGRYVKKIGDCAFWACINLEKLVLPSVEEIGKDAFEDCYKLVKRLDGNSPSIWLTGNTLPTIKEQNFEWCDKNYTSLSYKSVWYDENGNIIREYPVSIPTSYHRLIIAVSNSSLLSSLNVKVQSYPKIMPVIGGPMTSTDEFVSHYWFIRQNSERLVIYNPDMDDYTSASATPWYAYRSQIKYIDLANSKDQIIGKNAFSGLSNLKYVYFDGGSRITKIGEGAFANCTNLENIEFVKIAQEIGRSAFAGCSKVNNKLIISAATTIGDAAFDGCHFNGITFGDKLTSIGQNAFRGSLASGGDIYVFTSVPTTNANSFSGANTANTTLHVTGEYWSAYTTTAPWSSFQLDKSQIFPIGGLIINGTGNWSIDRYGVLTINGNTPDYNSTSDVPWYIYRDYFTKIKITENCFHIGKNTFASANEGESQVSEVVVPASVETIGENAFKNNDQIEEVKAEGVKNIGSQAFENCSSLEKVKFGKEVSSMGEKVFNNCGIVDVMAVKSATPPAVTARTFLGMGIVSSNAPAKVKAKYAARRATSGTGQKSVSLEVPDEHISKYLAAQYWNLFTFEYIGEHGGIVESDQAYDGLYVLYSDGTMIISASAPTDPQNINTGFTISSSAKSKVKRVEIQGLLTKLGHQFNDCPNLEEVVLSGGINSLNGTFNNCPKLKSINLDNVQYLKSHQQGNKVIPCFGGCVALQEVNVPNVLEIGDNCFKGCTGLTTVALGGEAEVGMEAFSGCSSLKRIVLGNAKLNGALQAFQGCTALEEMTYSGTRMPAEIFKGCTALHKINLGGSLKDILSEAFANTAIDSIYVQCPTPPEAAANAFSGITLSSIKVIVPDAFDGPYSSAPVWEEMFTYEDEDYAELDFPIHFAIGNNGFGTVDESGNLTINAMGALVDNFRDYVEPYAPYIIGEIRIGNEVSSLPAGTPYRLPFGWVKEDGPRAIILGSGLLELGDYALYNNVWDCDLIVDCYALNPPVMNGANVFNWSKIQNGSQCVATLNVVNDAAVEAAYRADTYWKKFSISSVLTPADAPAECTVTFVDWDGTILQQTTTRPGMMVTPPADPVREGYTFKGWDSQDYTWVVSDLTITATYYDETYTVRFYDWDGTLLSEQQVHYGQAAEAPADPAREGYTFLGWSEDFSAVTLDKYIVAMYHNDHEGIEDIQPDQVPNIKVLIDGVIYILRDGKIYNLLGIEVK